MFLACIMSLDGVLMNSEVNFFKLGRNMLATGNPMEVSRVVSLPRFLEFLPCAGAGDCWRTPRYASASIHNIQSIITPKWWRRGELYCSGLLKANNLLILITS